MAKINVGERNLDPLHELLEILCEQIKEKKTLRRSSQSKVRKQRGATIRMKFPPAIPAVKVKGKYPLSFPAGQKEESPFSAVYRNILFLLARPVLRGILVKWSLTC